MTRRWVTRSVGCLLVLLVGMPLLAQMPPQFSADMQFTVPNSKIASTAKLFFGGEKVRVETNAMGRPMIMISDNAGKNAYMLMPEQHMYMDLSNMGNQMAGHHNNRPDWHAYDAANPCAGMADTTCQKAGTEEVNGRLCNKWQFTGKGKTTPDRTVWIDQKSGIPIKGLAGNGSAWELSNIKEGTQSAKLFEIPDDYQKFDMDNMMRGMRPPQ